MKKSNFVALILGTVGCVFFALGMCMCLIQEWGVSRQGIVCGAAGLVVLLADLLIWRKMEGKAPIVVSPRTLGLVALGVAGALLLGVGMCLSMVFGKLYNARWSVERTRRDHGLRVDAERLTAVSGQLKGLLPQVAAETSLDSLRGLEGAGATAYFGVFDELILGAKPLFAFNTRSRRPPLDPINALLSFAYSLLANDCASALESVGLDSYVGFLHRDRPGRSSLALDLMEELRPCMAERFVLTLVNNRVFGQNDFTFSAGGGVYLCDEGRRTFLRKWQERKREAITHPFLGEKIYWGLVPFLQALLLARYLRDDLDEYPPFLWK